MNKLNNRASKSARKAVEEFRDRLISKSGKKIDALIVYGSFINGKYRQEDSDIDIMVLAKEKSVDEEILNLETAISLKYGVVISALMATREEWQGIKSAGYSFPEEIRKGKVIYERSKRRNKVIV